MIRFIAGLLILIGVAGNDCDGACGPGMSIEQMMIWSTVGIFLMCWSLPKLIRQGYID